MLFLLICSLFSKGICCLRVVLLRWLLVCQIPWGFGGTPCTWPDACRYTCPQPAAPWGEVEASAWPPASLGLVSRLWACDLVAGSSARVVGVADGDSSVVTGHAVKDP